MIAITLKDFFHNEMITKGSIIEVDYSSFREMKEGGLIKEYNPKEQINTKEDKNLNNKRK